MKLGSYRRAKGLEFKHVYLPQYTAAGATAAGTGDAARERRTLARSQLYVAMTRARDTLWLGSVTARRPGGPAAGDHSDDRADPGSRLS